MTESQIQVIMKAMKREAYHDIPAWAKGLEWFTYNRNQYPECAWDFGLYADAYLYRRLTDMDPELSAKLQQRLNNLELESERKKRPPE